MSVVKVVEYLVWYYVDGLWDVFDMGVGVCCVGCLIGLVVLYWVFCVFCFGGDSEDFKFCGIFCFCLECWIVVIEVDIEDK